MILYPVKSTGKRYPWDCSACHQPPSSTAPSGSTENTDPTRPILQTTAQQVFDVPLDAEGGCLLIALQDGKRLQMVSCVWTTLILIAQGPTRCHLVSSLPGLCLFGALGPESSLFLLLTVELSRACVSVLAMPAHTDSRGQTAGGPSCLFSLPFFAVGPHFYFLGSTTLRETKLMIVQLPWQ